MFEVALASCILPVYCTSPQVTTTGAGMGGAAQQTSSAPRAPTYRLLWPFTNPIYDTSLHRNLQGPDVEFCDLLLVSGNIRIHSLTL